MPDPRDYERFGFPEELQGDPLPDAGLPLWPVLVVGMVLAGLTLWAVVGRDDPSRESSQETTTYRRSGGE